MISLIWGRRGRIIKIQSVRDIEDKDLAPGVEKAPLGHFDVRNYEPRVGPVNVREGSTVFF